MKRIKEYILNFINGFCMALADSVPGVSGGTVAFILGFYDKFIISLDDFFRGSIEKKKKAFGYLFKIGIGWAFGMLLAISFLANLFDKYIYQMSSLFIGFIVFALPIVIKEEKEFLHNKYGNIVFLLIGAFIVVLITYLNRVAGSTFNIDSFNIGTIMYVFFAAALAISAMILPGISGSTILLIFGLYIPIITKVKMLLTFNFSALPIIIVFGLGILFGILFFTRMLRKNLDKRRSAVIYMVLGMMIASIYSIIVGPSTLKIPKDYLTLKTFNFWFFVLGGIIILSLEGIKELLEKKEK
jgi:putative membrane protein